MMSESTPIRVQILGKEYHVSCDEHEWDDLMAAARHLDARMRHIRDNGRVIGTERIAVMAALNIAHELIQSQQQNKQLLQQAGERISGMQRKIDAVTKSD